MKRVVAERQISCGEKLRRHTDERTWISTHISTNALIQLKHACGMDACHVDLIVWGRSYFDVHRRKDRWAKTMGRWHRRRDHNWYMQFGSAWTLENPFPSSLVEELRSLSAFEAEQLQVDLSHDYLDRIWDCLSEQERRWREGFFAWLVMNPELLISWAGVDVLRGRIARTDSNQTRWNSCPTLRGEYKRLRKYVESVVRKDPQLRSVLNEYGDERRA